MIKTYFIALLGCLILYPLNAQESVLDSSFNSTGIVTTTFGSQTSETAYALVNQADGKVVVAGRTFGGSLGSTRLCLSRYKDNGNLDPAFSSDGKTTLLVGDACEAHEMALQPDGKIVVTGFYAVSDVFKPFVARFNANGSPDNSFGTNGVVKFEIPGFAESVAVQPDGKIVLGGYSEGRMMLARLLSSGIPDLNFGAGGLVFRDFGGDRDDRIQALALQSDGKIITGGLSMIFESSSWAVVCRYLPNGSADPDFGQNGIAIVNATPYEVVNDLLVTPGGEILIAGSAEQADWSLLVAKFKTDGQPAVNFGDNGSLLRNYDLDTYGLSIGLLSDGRVVVAGAVYKGYKNDFMVARFSANGQDDPTFGEDGKALLSLNTFYDVLYDLAVLPDDRFVAAGHYMPFTNGHVVIRCTDKAVVETHQPQADRVLCRVYPNPLQENSVLECYFNSEQVVSINLTDVSGRVFRQIADREKCVAGQHVFPLLPADLPAGQYFLTVQSAAGQWTVQLNR